MGGMPKRREKEDQLRKQLREKGQLTREELQGQLLKGVRAEQLDTTTEDALTAKNRIHRLSSVGAERARQKGLIREDNVTAKMPPRWERLLSAEFTTCDWNLVMQALPEEAVRENLSDPKTVLNLHEHRLKSLFWKRIYEDQDMFRIIKEAYMLGVEHANDGATGQGVGTLAATARNIVNAQRKIIDFLIQDHEERINPILTLTPRELVERVTMYFVECDLVKRFYTVPGLAFYIGFATRDDFFAYLEHNPDSILTYIIKRAVTFIEAERVTDMLYGGGLMAGHKIDLATNFNYNDAGKKSDSPPASQTNITVNNNTISLDSAPPKPKDLNEWYSWYVAEGERKKALAEQPPAIDVTPQLGPGK